MKWRLQIGLLLAALGLAASAHAAEVRATASLEPEEVALGEAARLILTVEGAANVRAPASIEVDGLQIVRVGHSSNLQFQLFGGHFSGEVTYTYQVVPIRTGVFTIPAIEVDAGGQSISTAPVTLRVAKPYPSQTPGPLPPSAAPSLPPAEPPDEAGSEVAIIRLNYPKRDFYVGELVPVDLTVYLHRGLRISEIAIPTFSGTAFTIGRLGNKPEQRTEIISGQPYGVLTWHTAVAAVKPGDHPLGASMGMVIEVEDRSLRNPDFFGGGPLLDRFFGPVQKREVTLSSPDATVKILPLPEEGRPGDFSGAIGQFRVSAEASARETTAGDPVTLKLIVSGTGNFDRVKAPEFGQHPGFKSYTPGSKFEPDDMAGYSGKKIFEQVLIPQSAEIASIPPVPFSYFDPMTKRYVTLKTQAIPLKVRTGSAAVPPASSTVSRPAVAAPPQAPKADPDAWVSNRLEIGKPGGGLVPVSRRPWFWALQSAPAAALLAGWWIARRRDRLANDPRWARSISASRAVQAQINAMSAALKQGDAQAFFLSARRALQERVGEKLQITPETITIAEIEERFGGGDHGWNDSVIVGIKSVFEAADAVAYSGQRFSAESLGDWRGRVESILRDLGRDS